MVRLLAITIAPLVTAILLLTDSSGSARQTVKLAEKDSGGTVEMYVGDALEVVLKGNPTTGYMWEVASVDSAVLEQVGEAEFKTDRRARGSGGQITMRFEALKVGKIYLKLIHHRPFEKNVPPIKIFEVTIIVKQ
jgi:inhibitor of cysteine peptidase